jgi:hypothetical protein
MVTKDNKNLQSEFEEFLNINPADIDVSPALFTKIKNRLFPNSWIVFGKVALVHVVFGLLSLSVCNQFGLNPFGTGFSFSDWFMKIGGHPFCMSLCGVLFMGSTFVFSNLFLTLEELEAVKRQKWLQTAVFAMVSLAAFYFFGAHVVATVTVLWVLGALIGGVLSVELSYRLRQAWA